MTTKGIDVSKHQGTIDFGKVKASGYDFVIIRAGYGRSITQMDERFEQNYRAAKAAGLDVGAYWYSYAKSEAEAVQEAKVFLQAVKGKQFEYPLYMDVEEAGQFRLGKSAVSRLICAFLHELEQNGYWAGLYMSTHYLTNFVDESIRKRYAIWVAQYSSACSYKGEYGIWQYGIAGNSKWDTQKVHAVNGIAGECDLDYSYVDYPSLIRAAGRNGFPKTSSKSVDELAREVIDGKWGNGDDRKARLNQAGYDYNAVQTKVNELVGAKSTDELAREVAAGKWGNGDARRKALTAAGYDYKAVQEKVNQMLKQQ